MRSKVLQKGGLFTMRNFKHFISLLLVVVLTLSFSMSVAAAESDTPTSSEVEEHTIEFVLEPGESTDDVGITPYIWNEGIYYLGNQVNFVIPDRYFGFEYWVTDANDNPCASQYNIILSHYGILTVSVVGTADSSWHKKDWIDVTPGHEYSFTFSTSGTIPLKFHLKYYSWK